MSDPEQLKKHEINEDKNTEPTKTEYDTLTEVKPFNAEQARKNVTEAKAKIAEEKRIAEEQAQIAKEQARNRRASQEKYRQVQEQRKEEERQRKEKEEAERKQREHEKHIEQLSSELPKAFMEEINSRIEEASKKGFSSADFIRTEERSEDDPLFYGIEEYEGTVDYSIFTGDILALHNVPGDDAVETRPTSILTTVDGKIVDKGNKMIRYGAYYNTMGSDSFKIAYQSMEAIANLYAEKGFRVDMGQTENVSIDGLGEVIKNISWGPDDEPGVIRAWETNAQEDTVTKTPKRTSLRGIFKKKNNN